VSPPSSENGESYTVRKYEPMLNIHARKSGTLLSGITHGHCSGGPSPAYKSWLAMLERCLNPPWISLLRAKGRQSLPRVAGLSMLPRRLRLAPHG
jgi:hypothetical protein